MSPYIAAFIFPSILTSLSVPPAENHPHSMMPPPSCFTIGIGGNEWCLVSSKQDALHSPKGAFSSTSQRFSMGLRSGLCGGQSMCENDVSCSLNHSFTIRAP
ncbi:hypothetical protein ATANTOWER_030338 [Ataeniobius toweri]|uniref:Secreted protein n=1 Tax=Ataeniobius toweri TaxID=208326 RepID=A0ABU7BLA8_9TELE|nr:hypothetical protein [Ataeniobius toweri]